MSDATTVFIKLYIKDTESTIIKRFAIKNTDDNETQQKDSLESFLTRVKESGVDVSNYIFQYKDEENDMVTFSTQKEFEVALSLKSPEKNLIRLYFVNKQKLEAEKKVSSNYLETQERRKKRGTIAWTLRAVAIAMIFIIFAIMLYPNVEHTATEICSTANVARPLYSDKYWIEVAQKNFKENACSEERPRKVNLEEMRERERRLRDQFLKENREREERLHREKMEALFREQREKVQRQERERERIERERQEHERLERERIQREQKEREELEKKRQQRYEELNNFLAKLGFDNRELNMALLRIHDADLQRVINALQQYR